MALMQFKARGKRVVDTQVGVDPQLTGNTQIRASKTNLISSAASRAVLLSCCLGAMFDGFDASIFGIVLFPAISDLIHSTSHAVVAPVGSVILAIFMIGWALGAFVFGALSDRIGRVRTMTFTILLYAISAGLCATSHSWQELAFYRFLVGFGIGGEQGAGAILLSEYFRGKNRYWSIGLMAVFLCAGYVLTTGVNFCFGQAGWRYICLSGLVPAFLAFYVRLKLSEAEAGIHSFPTGSQVAAHSQLSSLVRLKSMWSDHGRKTLIIMALASASVINWWAVLSWVPAWINQLTGGLAVVERSLVMLSMYTGAIVGSLAGIPVLLRLRRRRLFVLLAFTGALSIDVAMFLCTKAYGPPLIVFAFIAGVFAIMPFLWLNISVPELYPIQIRGTAYGISVQAGRIFAAIAALAGGQVISAFHGSYAIAGSCVALINLVGIVAAFFVPEEENYLLATEAIAGLASGNEPCFQDNSK